MSQLSAASLTAVLGPTNTGKTHLAVERMCGHVSGMIGFPLRLLAREVYDRVVAIKGAAQVALITGEEKILPKNARYFLCTAESMPGDRDVAFVALDEGQVGADPERGHIFTDRMLNRRGYAETMILGSETLRPLIRRLLPDCEIITRPRFSTLSYAPPKKLSRLPKRSAIVAFTAAEVYALAEMLRRHKGGAAVVMGALSPRTRNAQVAMYQSGEVDYLVATDAIGMGLNMDIAHVAFASLHKFDGKRQRRLTTSELAQIAGRAGRHQRDGTFGVVQLGHDHAQTFEPEEIEAIENHRFPPLSHLVWRNPKLDFHTLPGLISSLEQVPTCRELLRRRRCGRPRRAAPYGERGWHRRPRARPRPHQAPVGGVPAARLPQDRARSSTRAWSAASSATSARATAHCRPAWIASEVAALDNVAGDIATLSGRIAAARTWTYAAHRPGWIADAAEWAEKTRALEDRLSDALHQRLTQRFVDRRTAVLLKDFHVRGEQRVAVDADGTLAVEGEAIGTLDGFRFTPDPSARAGERKLLLAAAERHLPRELARRAVALADSADSDFSMAFDGGMPPRLLWKGARVAKLRPGRDALHPRIDLDRALETIPTPERARVVGRLAAWFEVARDKHLAALTRVDRLTPGPVPCGARDDRAAGRAYGLRAARGAIGAGRGADPPRPQGAAGCGRPARRPAHLCRGPVEARGDPLAAGVVGRGERAGRPAGTAARRAGDDRGRCEGGACFLRGRRLLDRRGPGGAGRHGRPAGARHARHPRRPHAIRAGRQLGRQRRHEPRRLRPADARAWLQAARRRRCRSLRLGRHPHDAETASRSDFPLQPVCSTRGHERTGRIGDRKGR